MERELPNFYFTNRMMDNEFYISGSTNSNMVKNSSGLWIALGIVVIGLVLLLYGEYVHQMELVWGGGILALAGVAIQAYLIATQKE
tara:strand:+ start:313 stop:570 length:258 start_codon:yes stop_codon:yes gene_type:complete